MSETLWVGTTQKFQALVRPGVNVPVRQDGFSDGMSFENGGQFTVRSAAAAKVFGFNFGMKPVAEIAKWRNIRQGGFGSGLLYFADPMAFESNMCPAQWAAPGLIEQDWPTIYDTAPTFANTAANSYSQPLRSAVFSITQAANTAPANGWSQLVIPVPPDMTLHLGVSGSATGTGVVRAEGFNIAAGTSSGSALTLLSPTASTRLNKTFAGSSYDYVIVDLRRTSSAASTVTIVSMLAQLYVTGASPTLTGNHQPGEGHTGLRMVGWEETYAPVSLRSAQFSLFEVGGWMK